MRALATLTLILGFAIPAVADDCVTVRIGHNDRGPYAESVENPSPALRYSVNGSFVWFTWGHEDGEFFTDDGYEDTLSFDVSDPLVESATACPDGSVEIQSTTTQPTVTTTAQPSPTTTAPTTTTTVESSEPMDLWCDTFPAQLEQYCLLVNRVLRFVQLG